MSSADTIVVGAGLTGLAAANVIHRAGRDVMVLEASDRPGGRIMTMSRNGDFIEAGGQAVFSNYTEMFGLIDQVGLTGDLVPSSGYARYIDRTGASRVSRGNLDLMRILGLRGAADLLKFRTNYFARAKPFSVFEIAKDIPEYDDVSAEQEFKWAGKSFSDFVLRPMIHGMTGSKPAHVNLYHVINCLKQRLTTTASTLRQGNVTLCERLAETLPVTYGAEVTKVLTTKGKVDGVLLADGRTIKANHVILAPTADVAGRIVPDEFGPAKSFLSSFTHTPLPIVVLFLDRPLDREIYGFGHPFQDTIYNMTINHTLKSPHRVPSGKAIISLWPAFPGSAEMEAKPDDEVIAQALKDVQAIYPDIAGMIEEARVIRHRWGYARHEPGKIKRILDFKAYAETLPGLSFASNDFNSVHMEAGIRSAQRAARRAMAA